MEFYSTRVPPGYLVGWENEISRLSGDHHTDFAIAAVSMDAAVEVLHQIAGSRAKVPGSNLEFETRKELSTTSREWELQFFCERLQADLGSIRLESVGAKSQNDELKKVRLALSEGEKRRVVYVTDEEMLDWGIGALWKHPDLLDDINAVF